MTYTPNIPQTGESLGSTRARINTNFQEIFSVMNLNHVPFNSTGEGKHKFLQMPEQLSAPGTLTNEGGLYTKVGVGPAETNLFFQGENGGFEYQLTRVAQADISKFAVNAVSTDNIAWKFGWTFLPGGIILNYGTTTTTVANATVTFAKQYTATPFFVFASSGSVGALLTTGFTRVTASGMNWFAIGV